VEASFDSSNLEKTIATIGKTVIFILAGGFLLRVYFYIFYTRDEGNSIFFLMKIKGSDGNEGD
jgi:hypothetical protein